MAYNYEVIMTTLRNIIGSIVNPPDGYVLTYRTTDGYWSGQPLPNPGQIMSLSSPGASPYNVGIEDVVPVPTHSGTYIVNLPATPQIGRTIVIKDAAGVSALNPINIAATPLIDGAATYVLNVNYGSVRVIFNGTTYLIIDNYTPGF